MVRITFDVDDDVMRADADNEVSEARRGLLVETYFEFPVHFVVGDTDLLRASGQRDSDVQLPMGTVLRPDERQARVPVLHLATSGLDIVRSLPESRVQSYELPGGGGEIAFAYAPDATVQMYSGISRSGGIANHSELVEAVDAFADAVRKLMLERVPWVGNLRWWRDWLACSPFSTRDPGRGGAALALDSCGPDLDERQLGEFECSLGTRLPEDYREFLLRFNGGRPLADIVDVDGAPAMPTDVQVFFGIDRSIWASRLDWNREAFADPLDHTLLPIATDSGGSLFCLVLRGSNRGAVFYWDFHGTGSLYPVAPTFTAFLDRLRESP